MAKAKNKVRKSKPTLWCSRDRQDRRKGYQPLRRRSPKGIRSQYV